MNFLNQSDSPPQGLRKPSPPPGPPNRSFAIGLFGEYETKDSIRQREDYEIYMKGWKDGINSIKASNK